MKPDVQPATSPGPTVPLLRAIKSICELQLLTVNFPLFFLCVVWELFVFLTLASASLVLISFSSITAELLVNLEATTV